MAFVIVIAGMGHCVGVESFVHRIERSPNVIAEQEMGDGHRPPNISQSLRPLQRLLPCPLVGLADFQSTLIKSFLNLHPSRQAAVEKVQSKFVAGCPPLEEGHHADDGRDQRRT